MAPGRGQSAAPVRTSSLPFFVLTHDLLVVGVHQQGQHRAVGAQRRLDDVGNVVLVLLLIEIGQILTGGLLVLVEVVICAVGHAPELAPAEGEQNSKSVVALE
jgi:hypothetical protein